MPRRNAKGQQVTTSATQSRDPWTSADVDSTNAGGIPCNAPETEGLQAFSPATPVVCNRAAEGNVRPHSPARIRLED